MEPVDPLLPKGILVCFAFFLLCLLYLIRFVRNRWK